MFDASAAYFDLLYGFRDQRAEARHALRLVRRAAERPIRSALDVGCATGDHAARLGLPDVVGLDVDAHLVRTARAKHPHLRFVCADFVTARLERSFDAIVSFYGVVAYARTRRNLARFAANVALHLAPGGVALVEPWHLEGAYTPAPTARHVVAAGSAIARASVARVRGRQVALDVHYLVAKGKSVRHLREIHRLGLFSRDEHLEAFGGAGLRALWSDASPTGRGAVLAIKPK